MLSVLGASAAVGFQLDLGMPIILSERGVTLSGEKTVITHTRKGFTFLGQTFRKHGRVLPITPSTEGVLALVRKVGRLIKILDYGSVGRWGRNPQQRTYQYALLGLPSGLAKIFI